MSTKEFMLHGRHIPLLLAIEIIFIIVFAFCVDYDDGADSYKAFNVSSSDATNTISHYYAPFQDVHVMMFIGFGFLMTFLKRYGYSAVGLNFLIAAIVLQWATLCQGFFHSLSHHGSKIHVNITNLLNADFSSATILISFGAVLGKTTPLQLIVMALCEVVIFAGNEYTGLEILKVSDVGGSIFVHMFGAYFGLMVSLVLRRDVESEKEGATYQSDIFAMIGTIFLWMFWPSFNSALAEGDAQHRAVINTYYSLAACCVVSFALSSLISKENKLDMVHIQNSTLAGGVAIGTAADMMIHPFGSMIVGSIAGIISVLGYRYLTPLIHRKLGIHDTCGVHNLHGMPGIIAAIVGAITASLATEAEYNYSLYRQFPARAPLEGTIAFAEIQSHYAEIHPGLNRTASEQGCYQAIAIGMTLAVAIVGGLVTGLIMRLPIFGKVSHEYLFDDGISWEVPDDGSEQVGHHAPTEILYRTRTTVSDSKM